jgi:hypothetical protein
LPLVVFHFSMHVLLSNLQNFSNVRFQVLMWVSVTMLAFWDVTPNNLLYDRYQRFGETCSGKVLLVLASTVNIVFRSRRGPWPYSCLTKTLSILKWRLLFNERCGLNTAGHFLSIGVEAPSERHPVYICTFIEVTGSLEMSMLSYHRPQTTTDHILIIFQIHRSETILVFLCILNPCSTELNL